MGWWNKLVRERKKQCLVCHKKGSHTASVKYRYDGGEGTAPLCEDCAKHFEVFADAFEGDDNESI